MLPYKRFATPCLLERSHWFLQDSKVPEDSQVQPRPKRKVDYRGSVKHDRQRIGYPWPPAASRNAETSPDETSPEGTGPDEASVHQPIVDHSLIWRMVGWLGSLTFALDKACQMLLQRNPNSLCHRYAPWIDPAKARSVARQRCLETADHLLHVIPEWEAAFGEKFFPRFATRSGFD